MITNFEEVTKELTADERLMVERLIQGFSKFSKGNPVKSNKVLDYVNNNPNYTMKKKLSGARLRKLCNFIRSNSIAPLIATSNGYYISYDKTEIENEIKSMTERASAIMNASNGLQIFLK